MKRFRVDLTATMLALSFAGLAAIITIFILRYLAPPPVEFESIAVANSPVTAGREMIVVAETHRREPDGCTNGVQVEARSTSGAVTRLPVPARVVDQNVSTYTIEMPITMDPGAYWLRLRETVYCSDGPKISVAPWVPMEVVP